MERGVDARHMVALEIIVDVGFPVAVHLVGAALEELHASEIELPGVRGQFAQRFAQRPGFGIEIDEDQVEPFLEANGSEAEFRGIKIFDAIKFRGHE